MTCRTCNRSFTCPWVTRRERGSCVRPGRIKGERGKTQRETDWSVGKTDSYVHITDYTPSKSISCSCAIDKISSPSLTSTIFSRSPFEFLKLTLILEGCKGLESGKVRSTSTTYLVPEGGRVTFPCRVTSAKVSGLVQGAHSNTHQQMSEDHVLGTTLSRVTNNMYSVSFPHMFVFGSSASASLMPESIVKMSESMTSYEPKSEPKKTYRWLSNCTCCCM